MMSKKAIEIMNEKILSSDNMYAFDDITEEDFNQLSEEAQQKLNVLEGMAGKSSQPPIDFSLKGFELLEKTVKPHSTSAHIGMPISWIGCRVAVVRLDDNNTTDSNKQ